MDCFYSPCFPLPSITCRSCNTITQPWKPDLKNLLQNKTIHHIRSNSARKKIVHSQPIQDRLIPSTSRLAWKQINLALSIKLQRERERWRWRSDCTKSTPKCDLRSFHSPSLRRSSSTHITKIGCWFYSLPLTCNHSSSSGGNQPVTLKIFSFSLLWQVGVAFDR